MCINPVLLDNGQAVACHQCWQCIRQKVDDWTGRCIAESQVSYATRSFTLTYGRDPRLGGVDHVRAAVLTYSDVQAYIRSWRDAGWRGRLRYFVCGEYGSLKGRAHWHGLLFFKDGVPLRPLEQQFQDEHWPHGWSYWQLATPNTVQYVTKYIVKEAESDERQYHQMLSKIPPLGTEWFRQYAGRYVEQRLAPQDLFYSFPEVVDRHGRPKVFRMTSVTAERFLQAYVDQWRAAYGRAHMPNSEVVEAYLDRQVRQGDAESSRIVLANERLKAPGWRDHIRDAGFTGVVMKPKDSDLRSWMDPKRLTFNERLNVWQYGFDGDQSPWYWAKSPEGVWSWRSRIGVGNPKPSVGYANARRAG